MSDEETGTETQAESESDAGATSAPVETTAMTDAAPALPSGEPEHVGFWHRPYVERYLTPLVLPLAAVVGVVVYVLNVSRLFLSAPGHVAVVLGTIITVVILFGATMLAVSPRLRSG